MFTMLELDDCIKFVDIIKDQINKEWLDSENEKISNYYKTPKNTRILGKIEDYANPLAYLIYQAENSIRESRLDRKIGPSLELIRATTLGMYFETLLENNVSGIEEKIHDLTISDKDGLEKIIFELDIAQSLVHLNHKVLFIPTNSIEHQKTPDILADELVEFECKKKDRLTKRDRQNEERWKFLARKLTDMMNNFKKFYFVYLFFSEEPTSKSVKSTLHLIRKNIQKNQQGEFTVDGVEIKISKICDFGQNFDLGVRGNTLPEIRQQITPDLLENFIKSKILFPELLDYQKILPNFDDTRHRLTTYQDGRVAIGDMMKFLFKTSQIPDRIKSVIKSIDHAKIQLSGERCGVICVNLTHISEKLIEADFITLRKQIDNVLKNNSTISAVILSSEYHFKENNSNRFLHKAIAILNPSAKHKIPENFEIVKQN